MATLNANAATLLDHAKRLDPDGKVATIVELLAQTNEVLNDMIFIEGNLPTGHRTTVRTGLPKVYWRLLNQGVPSSKSTTAQVDEGCGMLEAWSEVDVEVAKLNGNVNAFRLSEAQAYLEAMNQEHASTLFYGNSSLSPEEFNGLSVRFSDLTAKNGQNIIDAGGTGSDNTSIYFICWGANTVHGIFPKGSKAGIEHNDLGEQTVQDANGIAGAKLRVYQDQWKMKTGVAVRDWRYIVRICNIDVSDLNTASPADLVNLMIKAYHRIPNLNMGSCYIYMNRTVFEYLDIQRRGDVKDGGMLSYEEVDGKIIPHFRGIPIKKVDAILNTEEQVA